MAKERVTRVTRTGKLTPEEIARDREIRRKVEAEFPPLRQPVADSLTDRILEPLVESLTPEVARRIFQVRRPADIQVRVDELAAKANEGQLTAEERADYEALIEKADLLGIFKSLARQALAQ